MNCPKCGFDIGAYERCEAEAREQQKQKKEQEFEQAYGHILRPIRRKRAWVGGITGFVAGTLLFVIAMWLFCSLIPEGIKEFWEEVTKAPWYVNSIVLLVSLIPGIMTATISAQLARISWGRQEKEFRKNFGLLH